MIRPRSENYWTRAPPRCGKSLEGSDAAVGLSVPYERALNDRVTLSDGSEAGQTVETNVTYVTPGYFDTLGIPLVAGRVFTDADGPNSQHVAIVNQSFARKFYGGTGPVGRYFDKTTLIVGEVADVPVSPGLNPAAPLTSEQAKYVPAAQFSSQYLSLVHLFFQPDWIVRTAAPVQGLTGEMQHALSSADPNLPTSGFYSMDALLAQTLTTQRIEVALLGAMATLAFLLSAVGVFASGGQHSCAAHARDRHPHGARLDRRPGNGRDRTDGCGRVNYRRLWRPASLHRSAASDAQLAIRRWRLRRADTGRRGHCGSGGDSDGDRRAHPANRQNRIPPERCARNDRSFRNLRGSPAIRVIREAARAGRSWAWAGLDRRPVEPDVSCRHNLPHASS